MSRSRDWVGLTGLAVVAGAAAVYFAVTRQTRFPLILLLVAALAPVAVLASTGKGAAVVGNDLVFRNGRLSKRATIPLREIRELRWTASSGSSKILVLQVTHGSNAVDKVISAISVTGSHSGRTSSGYVFGHPGPLVRELEARTDLASTVRQTAEGPDAGPIRGLLAALMAFSFIVLPSLVAPRWPGWLLGSILGILTTAVDSPAARVVGDQFVVRSLWGSKNHVIPLDTITQLRMAPVIGRWTTIWVLRLTEADSRKPQRVWAIRQRRPGNPYWSTAVNQPTYPVGPILRELLDRTGLTLGS